jgi:uncharacterized Zn finger protein (UPF0148 family)
MTNCDHCGTPMDVFQGEDFCRECTYYEAVEQLNLARDEAQAMQFLPVEQLDLLDWSEEELPF